MTPKTLSCTLALAAALALAAPHAAAQDAANRPGRSISLSANSGGAAIGAWFRASDRLDLGIEAEARLDTQDNDDLEQTNWYVSAGPALKLYVPWRGAFQPYTYGSLFYERAESRYARTTGPDSESDRWGVGGEIGIGADWFVAQRVSVGGHVGLQAARYEQSDGEDFESSGVHAHTVNSGIRIHLYL